MGPDGPSFRQRDTLEGKREMKYLLATALVLSLCLPASADWRKDALADLRAAAKTDAPSSATHNGATIGWTFDILTIWQFGKHSTVKREPYGIFASRDECGKARAKKITGLDEGNYRQPHLLPDQPTITTSITIGTTTTTSQRPGGPTETVTVLSCHAESFVTVTHQKN
jgi:hypothetical protein